MYVCSFVFVCFKNACLFVRLRLPHDCMFVCISHECIRAHSCMFVRVCVCLSDRYRLHFSVDFHEILNKGFVFVLAKFVNQKNWCTRSALFEGIFPKKRGFNCQKTVVTVRFW